MPFGTVDEPPTPSSFLRPVPAPTAPPPTNWPKPPALSVRWRLTGPEETAPEAEAKVCRSAAWVTAATAADVGVPPTAGRRPGRAAESSGVCVTAENLPKHEEHHPVVDRWPAEERGLSLIHI